VLYHILEKSGIACSLKKSKKLLTRTENNVYLGCKGAFSLKTLLNSMEEHKDIFSFRKNSSSSIDYKNLVNEFLEEQEQ